jgi:hypothetical protein
MTALPHGTAEALAVCAHLEQLTDTLGGDAAEVSRIYRPLLGLNHADTTEVIEHLRDELGQLWSLISDDYTDDDLDDLPDLPRYNAMPAAQAVFEAHDRTIARLTEQIERYVEHRRQQPISELPLRVTETERSVA